MAISSPWVIPRCRGRTGSWVCIPAPIERCMALPLMLIGSAAVIHSID
jgi:hypothetical protein